MSGFYIENIEISRTAMPLVIPELGINHGGKLDVALRIVDAARRAGAKIIKHQTHIVEDEMSCAARNVIPGNSRLSIYDVMQQCALNEAEEKELCAYVQAKGMVFLSTPFSRAAADRLERIGVSAYKIGSGELNNYPLLEYIANFQKPMILSTGMNGMDAIKKAVELLERKNIKYALMHTTSLYPTPPNLVRLGAMLEMMEAFPEIPIGLSDHTLNNNACIAAVGLGASLVERHFVDHKERDGNDINCSMDETDLRMLLQAASEVYFMRGGRKEGLPAEKVTIDFAFASVVAIAAIKKGEVFSESNLWVKRPGIGGELKAADYNLLLGKSAACDIRQDTHINRNMVRW